MITIILCALICAGLGWLESADDYYTDTPGAVIGGFCLGGIIGFFVAIFIGIIAYSGSYTETTRPVPLVTLQDGSGIRGEFFLGSGVINDVSVFTWYEQSASNTYVQRRADADISAVHYTDGGAPNYTVTTKRREDGSFLGLWGIRMDAGEGLQWQYDFNVPRGSIKQDYTLDAK